LVVRGHFDPDWFSERAGLQPTSTVRESDRRPIPAKLSVWRLGTGPIRQATIPSLITDQLLSLLAPSAAQIKEAVLQGGLTSIVRFVTAFEDVVPRVVIHPNQLEDIARLGAGLEFSISRTYETDSVVEF
jgi:hypothetical protein